MPLVEFAGGRVKRKISYRDPLNIRAVSTTSAVNNIFVCSSHTSTSIYAHMAICTPPITHKAASSASCDGPLCHWLLRGVQARLETFIKAFKNSHNSSSRLIPSAHEIPLSIQRGTMPLGFDLIHQSPATKHRA